MIAPLAGKHDSNEDELETQQTGSCSICRETLSKRFWYLVYQYMSPKLAKARSAVRPAASHSLCYRLHPDTTRNSLGGAQHALLSYYYEVPLFDIRIKQIFTSSLSRIHFVIKGTTLMKAWKHASTLLSPYLSHINIVVFDVTIVLSITLLNNQIKF